MLLVVDAGNSNIHVGCFEEDKLFCRFALGVSSDRTSDEYAWILRAFLSDNGCNAKVIDGVMIGSVVPSMTDKLEKAIRRITSAKILSVGPGVKTGFPIKLDNPAELGADLAANAAGAIQTVGFPVIIADCGTATTVMAIDREGAYIGGCIMPGVGMGLDALNGAELLPEISVGKSVSPLGKNTKDCMRSGVIRGGAMSVCGFTELYRKNPAVGKQAPLVITGGYAEWLLPYLPENARHIPLLTLQGLCAIWHLNQKKN